MQSVDVGFTHVAFTVRCLASSIDFYTRYTAMTVIHQREPDLPSARKVAWLSDRTRPFALVLVQSDDPADTPLGPFGHLGVACATQAEIDEKVALARREGVLRREPEQLAIRWAISLSLPTRTVTPWSCRGAAGGTGSHPGGKTRRIVFHRLAGGGLHFKGIPRQHGAWRWATRKAVIRSTRR
ncbi:putative glyoxalase/bleomycin resistance protein/dioxygenase [Klebsiella pneumoniae]|uniref:Putative glyoxalase/bleomycin resistance protein/dioxygenase n=5 Tax=Enterobacteriaceae TaxID=543 RepID=A0A377WJJ2_KLEPN|nr:putative glyoxalase/bleomycin resistance protein/dioxygenase [Klebsiella pneumoniae]